MQKMLNEEKDRGDRDQHADHCDETLTPPIAIPAKTQPTPPNDISRTTIVHTIRPPAVTAPGIGTIATKSNINGSEPQTGPMQLNLGGDSQ
jgi:hypothetical protein